MITDNPQRMGRVTFRHNSDNSWSPDQIEGSQEIVADVAPYNCHLLSDKCNIK